MTIVEKEFPEFLARAKQGELFAQNEVACYYVKSESPNYVQAIRWFELAAKGGLVEAKYNLGRLLLDEERLGAKRNVADGTFWLNEAIKQGSVDAQYLLGSHIFTDRNSEAADYVRAIDLLRSAQIAGHPEAKKSIKTWLQMSFPRLSDQAQDDFLDHITSGAAERPAGALKGQRPLREHRRS